MTPVPDAVRLDGQRAVVTGASKGIGRAVVELLRRRGATVLAVARPSDELASLEGSGVRTLAVDLLAHGAVEAVLARGPADILVNNLGTNLRKPTDAWTDDDWRTIAHVNLDVARALTLGLLPDLRAAAAANRGGVVVTVSSVAAHRALRTSTAGYAMSKAALEAFSRFLAVEEGPRGVRFNAVLPWYVRTPLAAPVLADPARLGPILARTPLGRVGEPDDVAEAVAWLASPAARWVTGVCLPVDGGFLAAG